MYGRRAVSPCTVWRASLQPASPLQRGSAEMRVFDLLLRLSSPFTSSRFLDGVHAHSTSCTCLRCGVVAPILTLSVMNSNCPSDDKAVAENSPRIIKGMGEVERVFDRLFKVRALLVARAFWRMCLTGLSRCLCLRKEGHRGVVAGGSPLAGSDASDALFLSISSSSFLLCCHSGKGAMKHYG